MFQGKQLKDTRFESTERGIVEVGKPSHELGRNGRPAQVKIHACLRASGGVAWRSDVESVPQSLALTRFYIRNS